MSKEEVKTCKLTRFDLTQLCAPGSPTMGLKGWTIRKVMGGGGRGIFSSHDFFFRPQLVQEFFLQVKPSARIFFFQTNIALFLIY